MYSMHAVRLICGRLLNGDAGSSLAQFNAARSPRLPTPLRSRGLAGAASVNPPGSVQRCTTGTMRVAKSKLTVEPELGTGVAFSVLLWRLHKVVAGNFRTEKKRSGE